MFSNEVSHNWPGIVDGTGTNKNNTCLTRSNNFGSNTCGTFDGFGTWTWKKFKNFLDLFVAKHKLNKIGIYEWQFVPPQWLKGIDNVKLLNGKWTNIKK